MNPIFFCYSDLRCKRRWRGLKEMFICSVISSPFLLNLSPLPTAYPSPGLPFSCWSSDETESCYVTASVDRFPVLLSVCLFCASGPTRASAEDFTELLWNMLGECGATRSCGFEGFLFREDKKKKKILVVSNLICFHGESGKAACNSWLLMCCG